MIEFLCLKTHSKTQFLNFVNFFLKTFCDVAFLVHQLIYNEIKVISTVKVALIRKNIDELSKELRLTENKIQEFNWTIDLIE